MTKLNLPFEVSLVEIDTIKTLIHNFGEERILSAALSNKPNTRVRKVILTALILKQLN